MEEIIYKIDNWSIIKLVGGLSVVLIAAISITSNLLKSRLIDYWKSKDQERLEQLKGAINEHNSVLTTILAKNLPEKLTTSRLEAIEQLWKFVIATKNKPPASVRLALTIVTRDEFKDMETMRKFSKGLLENIKLDDLLMSKPMLTDYEELRYLLPTKLWTSIFIYQATILRICYLIISNYQRGQPESWQEDNSIKEMLKNILTVSELEYIYGLNIQAYDILLDLLEFKIITEANKILSGEIETDDTLRIVERIAAMTKAK